MHPEHKYSPLNMQNRENLGHEFNVGNIEILDEASYDDLLLTTVSSYSIGKDYFEQKHWNNDIVPFLTLLFSVFHHFLFCLFFVFTRYTFVF